MTTATETERQRILEIVARITNRDASTLQPGDNLADLGIDSLAFIMLILDVEQALERRIFNIESVGQLRTVGDLLAPLPQ